MTKSDCPQCQWSNLYSTCSDGSRELARYEHDRIVHADHEHVFGTPTTRESMIKGYTWTTAAGVTFVREETQMHCDTCGISTRDLQDAS